MQHKIFNNMYSNYKIHEIYKYLKDIKCLDHTYEHMEKLAEQKVHVYE